MSVVSSELCYLKKNSGIDFGTENIEKLNRVATYSRKIFYTSKFVSRLLKLEKLETFNWI